MKQIDECVYQEYREETLCLKGWCFGYPEDWKGVLFGDGKRVCELAVRHTRRTDVAKAYPEEPGAAESGIEVDLPKAPELAEKYGEIQVRIESGALALDAEEPPVSEPEGQGGDRKDPVLWSVTGKEMKNLIHSQLLRWHVDAVTLLPEGVFRVEGWAYYQKGECGLRLLRRPGGGEIPVLLERCPRPDVAGELHIPEKMAAELGFCVTVVNAYRIHKKEIFLEARAGDLKQYSPIGLLAMKRDRTRWGRVRQALALENSKKNAHMVMEKGISGFWGYLRDTAGLNILDYSQWQKLHAPSRAELYAQASRCFSYAPKLSICVPLYNTPIPYLKALVDSVRASSYRNWQLCLADGSSGPEQGEYLRRHYANDSRIVYRKLEKNKGISANTNEAVALAEGEYILFADHDDTICPDALYEIVSALNPKGTGDDSASVPIPDVLYTDEDKTGTDGKHFFEPNFKPDFNLFRLRENNYICHLFAVRRDLLMEAGLLDPAFDGAQDFDLILRCCEKAKRICHIPKALYHWRMAEGSTAADPASKKYAYEAGRLALMAHYRRLGIEARVELAENPGWYHSMAAIRNEPLVSILIPTKDHADDLRKCVESVLSASTYGNYEILVTDNGSVEEKTFALYQEWREKGMLADEASSDASDGNLQKGQRLRLIHYDAPFNFSSMNNFAAQKAAGEYLLFLNNDTSVITPGWMEEMLSICQQPQVAIVGAKLFYPDHTIQHAGVIVGMGGIAGHLYCTGDGNDTGYMGKLISVQELSAVTAACMMMKRTSFEKVGGYDESLAVAFNDVDLCMKVRAIGEKVVFTPHAQLYHYESKSRGLEDTPAKQKRFLAETERFKEKWQKELDAGDPYFSPNLSLEHGYCAPRGSDVMLK